MSKKWSAGGFKWVKDTCQFSRYFIKNCNKDNDRGYFLKVNPQYPKKSHNLHNDLPILPGRIKAQKVGKLVGNLHDDEEYAIHIKNLNKH